MGSILGNSLQSYVGVSQTETFSYKDYYSNFVLSTEALEVYESTTTENLNILNYKIFKIGNKISIEFSVEQSTSMDYEGYSFSYKINLTEVINYNEEGFVTTFTTDSSFTYNDNSTLTQKLEGTVELVK